MNWWALLGPQSHSNSLLWPLHGRDVVFHLVSAAVSLVLACVFRGWNLGLQMNECVYHQIADRNMLFIFCFAYVTVCVYIYVYIYICNNFA